MNNGQSIVILGGRSILSYLLINHLAERFNVSQVIFEQAHAKKMIQYRLKKLGAWTVAGQLIFLVLDRLVIQRHSQKKIGVLLAGKDVSAPDARIPTREVESVNQADVADAIRTLNPAAVVVTGTGIIGKKLLQTGPQFINIHCGITPRYRGVHGAFWAVVEGHPELAGTTVHLIDVGVDTGAIIGQDLITIDHDDTYRTLPIKQYLAGLNTVESAVRGALSGSLTTFQRDDLESYQWYSPTPLDYWRFTRNLRRFREM
jgi:folate-dependent phosphoribosylglycinamide formyltransferase PurN